MEYQSKIGTYHQENIMRTPTWTPEENMLFERALSTVPENISGRWYKIANAVPGKTAEQVKAHYAQLMRDLYLIESGAIGLPNFADDYDVKEPSARWDSDQSRRSEIPVTAGNGKVQRKRGTPWTREEHDLFVLGLAKHGRGNWRDISRDFVTTRTHTQVASHAQKYFLRQEPTEKKRKRASIHDRPPPPTNINTSGGGGGAATGPPLQTGYEYQENYTLGTLSNDHHLDDEFSAIVNFFSQF